jgi:hypothetical protein
MPISLELWISNLVGIARDIRDSEHQRLRWLAPDAAAWERPAELLCVLWDDYQLELFLKEEGPNLSSTQLRAAVTLLEESTQFDVGPDGWRDPEEVLNDPRWERVRQSARAFEVAFQEES